jgi:hypothetical protein
VSFLALRDLMRVIGYSSAIGWMFPAIIDTTVAVSTMMLVALGDKPARRARPVTTSARTKIPTMQRLAQPPTQSAKTEIRPFSPTSARKQTVQAKRVQTSALVQPDPQTEGTQVDADLASELITSGVTTQPIGIVIAVLEAIRRGASVNAAAKASGINYRTARRIVQAAAQRRQLLAAG